MNKRFGGLVLMGLCTLSLAAPAITHGQLRGSLGSGIRGGYSGGMRGSSRIGFRNNPISNPAPSLTPHQIFNPRGSISSGQIQNPAPSLSRPRSGISTTPVNRIDPYRQPGFQRTQAGSVGITARNHAVTPLPATARVEQFAAAIKQQSSLNTPGKIRKQRELALHLALLEQELRTYPNGERWITYLNLPTAEDFSANRDRSRNTGQELELVLGRFERVSSNSKYHRVSALTAFQTAQSTLKSYCEVNSEN